MRNLYPFHYKEKIHPRDILRNIVVDNASHLMGSGNLNALPEETVDVVLKRMASTGAKEIAVVDSDGRILADITAVDLLKYSESYTDKKTTESGNRGYLTPSTHNTLHAAPHRAFPPAG